MVQQIGAVPCENQMLAINKLSKYLAQLVQKEILNPRHSTKSNSLWTNGFKLQCSAIKINSVESKLGQSRLDYAKFKTLLNGTRVNSKPETKLKMA